jgi:hypothetical protein
LSENHNASVVPGEDYMNRSIRVVILAYLILLPSVTVFAQSLPRDIQGKMDALVMQAYQSAETALPCKIKSRGKQRMLRWEEVDRCVNDAAAKVDWEVLAQEMTSLRSAAGGLSAGEFSAAVNASFAGHALVFEKVFAVKDEKALLPLTNSLLRFLSADALQDVPVFDKTGIKVGAFAGVYSFERTGSLAASNTYTLVMFQYIDSNGKNQSAPDRLLLDSFGVPWREASSQRGFRLPSEKLKLRR